MHFITVIFFGIFASVFALILEFLTLSIFPSSLILETIFSFKTGLFFLVLAVIEEISKYLFLSRYQKSFAPMCDISLFRLSLLAVLFGIGFFSLEYILSLQEIIFFVPLGLFQSLLLHISTSFLLLFYLSHCHLQTKIVTIKRLFVIISVIMIHFLYNVFVFLV